MRNSKKIDTAGAFLAHDVRIKGEVTFQRSIRIEGRVQGNIQSSDGLLAVGEKALLDADIQVGTAVVQGRINGSLTAAEKVEVKSPGRIEGDIRAPVIAVEKGAVLNGKCVTAGKTEASGDPAASKNL